METSTPTLKTTTWWNVWEFYWGGFWACLFSGRLSDFAYLIAQAKYESRDDFSAQTFCQDINPWGLRPPSWSTRYTSTRQVPGGLRAQYPTYYACWKDRLEWDEKHHPDLVGKTGSLDAYMEACFTPRGSNNWTWSGYNIPSPQVNAYKQGWKEQWSNVPWLAKFVSGDVMRGMFKVLLWVFIPLAILAVFLFFRWIYRKVKRWKK